MGAHVWWPWFLERHWFAKGRLSGWAPDWYAGFPVGQYYFPLPAVMIAILELGDALQRRVQARDGERAADASGVGLLLRPRHARAVARTARVLARRARIARRDAQRLADLRRQHREHAGGRVLLHHRSRVRVVRARRARAHARYRETKMAPGRVDRGRGAVARRHRDLRRARGAAVVGHPAPDARRGRSRSRSASSRSRSLPCGPFRS